MSNSANKIGEARLLSKEMTDNPKLCVKKLSDGHLSIYLSYYLGYQKKVDPNTGKEVIKLDRRKEFLNLYMYSNPRTPDERQHNKEIAEYAKQIRYEREQSRILANNGIDVKRNRDVDFLRYYREYIESYKKKDIRDIKLAYRRFTDFLRETPKYSVYCNGIKANQITKDMILEFTEYLKTRSVGEGANTLYARFKKVVKHAFEHEVFSQNPCTGISIKVDRNGIKKDVLSLSEIRTLLETPFRGNQNIKRAFMFSLYTGLRWCDVKELTFSNVDFSNRILRFTQSKTDGHSSHANVTIPLTDSTLSIIGPKGKPGEKIFALPSYELSSRYVKMWVRDAGIDKHISWHCARHSFAVNVLTGGADIKTVSSLLGHSSIAMTEKYLHVVDSLKRQAVDILPAVTL